MILEKQFLTKPYTNTSTLKYTEMAGDYSDLEQKISDHIFGEKGKEEWEWWKNQLDEMEEAGIIERSQSPWGMPVTIVPKTVPDGTQIPRPCIDARDVNKLTKRDAFPLPRIDDILTMMESKPKYFSTLDLFSGYNQIKMTPRAKERCSIVTEHGQFSYN